MASTAAPSSSTSSSFEVLPAPVLARALHFLPTSRDRVSAGAACAAWRAVVRGDAFDKEVWGPLAKRYARPLDNLLRRHFAGFEFLLELDAHAATDSNDGEEGGRSQSFRERVLAVEESRGRRKQTLTDYFSGGGAGTPVVDFGPHVAEASSGCCGGSAGASGNNRSASHSVDPMQARILLKREIGPDDLGAPLPEVELSPCGVEQLSCKSIFLGHSFVGKTSLISRFVRGVFSEAMECTIGASFMTKCVKLSEQNATIKFEMWDTAGQERYHSLAPMYYRGANLALVLVDLSDRSSLDPARKYIATALATCRNGRPDSDPRPPPVLVAVVGSKSDLEREVSYGDLLELVAEFDLAVSPVEVSSLSGAGVNELFAFAADALVECAQVTSY
jgi:Ras-related protein Rab-5C